MRVLCSLVMASLASLAVAQSLRFEFDSPPHGELQGDARVESIGPTSAHFKSLPETNAALRLDGNGDYLRLRESDTDFALDFDQGDAITLEAWVKLDSIGGGQNVYVIGKGRTFREGPRNNQNYALRLRSVGGEARVSFLFRSRGGDGSDQDWHRWTSGTGIGADAFWHHIAVGYRFGEPKSLMCVIDGQAITSGQWDMGGATTRPPVVDDDEVWIGSSMGGSAGNSLHGAVDDVTIHRELLSPSVLIARRQVIIRPPAPPQGKLREGTVTAAIYEAVGSHRRWPDRLPEPMAQWEQSAFAVSQVPIPFGRGGVRRDWKGPSQLRLMAKVELPKEPLQWMVRAGGLTRLWIDDQIIAETPAHLAHTGGHGDVPPYTEPDPWLRPLRAGHHERRVRHQHEGDGPAVIALDTMIGADGYRYEAGEVIVAYRAQDDQPWHVLSLAEAFPLTDQSWRMYRDQQEAIVQRVDDRSRRQALKAEDDYWAERHEHARSVVAHSHPIGDASVDDFIDRKIDRVANSSDQAGKDLSHTARRTSLTDDATFLRRLMLDTVGVVPTIEEIRAFAALKGDRQTRRAKMIQRALADPRFADHWTAYWMDVLAENASVLKPTLNNSGPFRWYLYDMLRDDVAVDRWVTGLLRMEGSRLHGGAAGFAMAAENDVPMASKAHVAASAFLAVNMKCARCHDAPYHDWTQQDLFSLAAMMQQKPIEVPATSSVPDEFFAGEEEGLSLISLSLSPGEKVPPAWSLSRFVKAVEASDPLLLSDQPRERLAYQITRPENRQFARVIVNRLWQRLMGEGIVEPVDDWEGADPSHPELLEFLASQLIANRYDFKHVAALILNSESYQRRAIDRDVQRDEELRLFAAPRLRRMTAEQLVDSMHTVVGRAMEAGELTFDPEARMKPTAQNNLGRPTRAWQLTSLSNERDRPALSLPRAAAVAQCMEAFGWTGSRQEPINHRQQEANVLQPSIVANGLLSIQLTTLTDRDALTDAAVEAESAEALVQHLFQCFLTREPSREERHQFAAMLRPGFDERVLSVPRPAPTPIREPAVSWANHLHPRATEIRMAQADRLRHGPTPSGRLDDGWRQRLEDAVWALINTPEFIFVP